MVRSIGAKAAPASQKNTPSPETRSIPTARKVGLGRTNASWEDGAQEPGEGVERRRGRLVPSPLWPERRIPAAAMARITPARSPFAVRADICQDVPSDTPEDAKS